MIDKFISLFLKKKPDELSEKFNFRAGIFASVFGLCVNILLFASKLGIGIIASSISIIADAINNLSDSFSSCISIASFYISKKPADEEHPFGHARAEYLFSSVLAIVIVILGVQLLLNSVAKIKTPNELNISAASIIVLVFSILAKLFLSFFYSNIAKKINSSILEASSADSRADVLSTSVILIASVVYFFTDFSIDSYLGVLVSLMIIKSGFDILRSTIDNILGSAPTKKEVKEIQDFILSYEGIEGVHDLIIHDYGPAHRFVSAHAEVDAKENILKTHAIIDKIESDAVEKHGIQLLLHMDPLVKNDPQINFAKKNIQAALEKIGMHYNIHDFRVIQSYKNINVVFDIEIPPECKLSNKEISKKVIKGIKEHHPSYNPIVTVDRKYIRSSPIGNLK